MECLQCKFFLVPANERMGSCKRYPQAVNKIINDWCGEFSAIEMVQFVAQTYEPENKIAELLEEKLKEEPIKVEVQWTEPVKRKGRPKKNVD